MHENDRALPHLLLTFPHHTADVVHLRALLHLVPPARDRAQGKFVEREGGRGGRGRGGGNGGAGAVGDTFTLHAPLSAGSRSKREQVCSLRKGGQEGGEGGRDGQERRSRDGIRSAHHRVYKSFHRRACLLLTWVNGSVE